MASGKVNMNMASPTPKYRFAVPTDAALIVGFIRELAEYEQLTHQCIVTEKEIRETLFGERQGAEVVLAYWEGIPAGFALFFHNYSTFLGKPGIYLEDLYVKPEYRGRGLGKGLMRFVATLARERNCGRFEWAVLNWNQPSIEFYKSLGAQPMDTWMTYRLTGDALNSLGAN